MLIYSDNPLYQQMLKYKDHPTCSRAFDRGAADSYYRRGPEPHYYTNKNNMDGLVEQDQMTTEEVLAYHAGYAYNEFLDEHKDWGRDE